MASGRSQPTMITSDGRWPSSRYRDPSPSHDHAGSRRPGPEPPAPAARRATSGISVTIERSSSSADGARPSVRSTPRTGRPGAGPESVAPPPSLPSPARRSPGDSIGPLPSASCGFLMSISLLSMAPGRIMPPGSPH